MTTYAVDQYQQYRVSREDNHALIVPPLAEVTEAIREPISIATTGELEFCGKGLDDVRRQARQEVVQLAVQYTQRYSDPRAWSAEEIANRPIVLSGHQPELFHPGVWFKNFLLSRLAEQSGAIAINFLVDNDLCRSTGIRVPQLDSTGAYSAKLISFDASRDNVPWELRSLNSQATWDAFPAEVQRNLLDGQRSPLVHELWPLATEALRRTGRIGLALAEGRHRIELSEGLQTLEVPLSKLVSTRAFARFSIQLLAELPRFQEVYNAERERYRQAHRIRNSAHPVPPLEQEHGWIEAPWWVYRPEAPQRHRLWVRLHDEQLILSDRAGWQATIEGGLDCDNSSSQWLDLLADGVCLRPRALLTTMYLRLFVGDLFIHGIGGGKYDQLTDSIFREFFGAEPPPMAVATSTLHLPIASQEEKSSPAEIEAEIRERREQLWQLRFHAEASLPESEDPVAAEVDSLTARKKELLANIPDKGEKWEWHREMTTLNTRLRELSQSKASAINEAVEQLNFRLRQAKITSSREYSFCLFDRSDIVQRLGNLLP